MRETELYPPVKAFLEGQGYEVKAEVGPADVVACRKGEEPLVVELKTGFSLTLVHQAVARQALTDVVYVAVPRGKGRHARRHRDGIPSGRGALRRASGGCGADEGRGGG